MLRNLAPAGSYCRFVLVGSAIGLAAAMSIYFAETTFSLSTFSYAIAVLAVYLIGIVVSFICHASFTFGGATWNRTSGNQKNVVETLFKHALIAVMLGVLVTISSSMLRTMLLPFLSGAMAAGTAFAASAVVASVVSFFLNRRWVFNDAN